MSDLVSFGLARRGMLVAMLALAFMLAAVVVATDSTPASAFSSNYCGVLVSDGGTCWDGSGDHTWAYNEADYYGGGTLAAICDGMSNSGGGRAGSRCLLNQNFDLHCYGATSTYWHAYVGQHASNGASHTIYGYAQTGTCP
jgi:hypothetical protein